MSDQPSLLGDVSTTDLQQMLEADEGLPENQRKWAPMLVDLVRVHEAAHVRAGMDPEAAYRSAINAVVAQAEYFGGRPLYTPRGDRLIKALRDMEIFRRAKAGVYESLADEHGLTLQQVYRIVRQQQALHLRKLQGRLFND